MNTTESLKKLMKYCENEGYMGWDPFDGLNSNLFNSTFIKNYGFARLVMIQSFKRSPINLRKIFLVPKGHNSKGIALLLSGYCNLYNLCEKGIDSYGTKTELISKIKILSELLISLKCEGYSGACWGYNFGWQSRLLFYFPKNTPTVVATFFCVEALLKSYEITGNVVYRNIALSSANFVTNDLKRTKINSGFLISYSPIDGNSTVFNASLLGSAILSFSYKYSNNKEHKKIAAQIIRTVCNEQNKNGSWVYGTLPTQQWIDSFHTGYNLDAISNYQKITGDFQFSNNLKKGFDFYIKNFFFENGMPKYYAEKTYPIDIHCPGQLFVTLHTMNSFIDHEKLAKNVIRWTISNMQDSSGYFYYQKKKFFSSKISYMRWSNAFMFRAISYYLKNKL